MPPIGAHAADRAPTLTATPDRARASTGTPERARTGTPTRKLQVCGALAAIGAVAGLAAGLPQLVALAAPFAVYAAVGLALARAPQLESSVVVERRRALEGETLGVTLELDAATAVYALELAPRVGKGVELAGPEALRWPRQLEAGERRDVRLEVRVGRWGAYDLGTVQLRARDAFGLLSYELSPLPLGPLRALPRRETLRALLAPLELQATTGSRTARERGEGIEFAENRPFVSGDRLRRINWRLTARQGTPYVSERHPERNADVLLFLDTYAEAGSGESGTLAASVRAAVSLAAAYLARKDRVGVVGFGAMLTGVQPRLGNAQLYRIIDALLGSVVVFSYAHKDVSFVPRRLLPAKALVVGISPLLDGRYVDALLNLRSRGFDLAVLEVAPEPFTPPGSTDTDALAHRLWLLEREALRTRLQALGAPVTRWREDQPLQVPLATTAELKRRQRRPLAA
jgi:uncharacterized protein (DUF58 family)